MPRPRTRPMNLTIIQMLGVDAGGKIDLERAVLMCWIFEKMPIGVEQSHVRARKRIL